jgi:integrase/recombinase XerD
MRGLVAKLHLPWDEWPEDDRRLWEAATAVDDPFEDAGGARLAEATLASRWFGWRRFLGFLAIEDPAALGLKPFERLNIERVRSFATHLGRTNTPLSVAMQTDKLYGAARLLMNDKDWRWLREVKRRLFAAAPACGATGPVITSLQLLELGQQLMDESAPCAANHIGRANAIRYRDGLMIALLAFIPLRRKNLAAIEIGRHLLRDGDTWFIVIPRAETKTRTSIEFALPELLEPYLATYLAVVRPRMLASVDCKALWVSPQGGALTYSAIWPIVTRRSKQGLGLRISPHDARDAAATTWAVSAPDEIGVARDLLGHNDLRTTGKHYNRARGIEASRAQAGLIAQIRKRRKGHMAQTERRDGGAVS